MDWRRRRRPDEVPTPVAVAVADFCRRAGAAAAPAEVREALSCLSEEDDFRVTALTDDEPTARPLGPYAVVDVLGGTPATMAALRETSGYYALVRELVEAREQPLPVVAPAPPQAIPVPRAAPAEPARPKRKAQPESVAERIAPKVRAKPPAPEPSEEPEAPAPELPRPRGRYTRLPAVKRPVDELFAPEARELLENLVDQLGNRVALTHSLAEQFEGRSGAALNELDVMTAVERLGLRQRLRDKERELILARYREHRGASGRAAWALGISQGELARLVKSLELGREVEEIRERFRREALAHGNLRHRLDLAGRTRYLADLGIQRRFRESLAGELRALFVAALPGCRALPELIAAAARREGLPSELLSRTAQKLGMNEELERLLQDETRDHVP